MTAQFLDCHVFQEKPVLMMAAIQTPIQMDFWGFICAINAIKDNLNSNTIV